MSKRSALPSRQCTKKRKYASTFKASWIGDLDWTSKSDRGASYAYCRICNSHFGVGAGLADATPTMQVRSESGLGTISAVCLGLVAN